MIKMPSKLEKRAMLHHNLGILYILILAFIVFLVFFLGINLIDIMEDIRDTIVEFWG